jgi:predicted ferric reductase
LCSFAGAGRAEDGYECVNSALALPPMRIRLLDVVLVVEIVAVLGSVGLSNCRYWSWKVWSESDVAYVVVLARLGELRQCYGITFLSKHGLRGRQIHGAR